MRSFNYLRRQGLHKRQKKLRLSGSFQAPLCKGICKCAKHACRRRRDGFGNRAAVGGICKCAKHACRRRRDGFCLPCVRGGGPRERWKGFASVRSTLAGVAETGCKKQSLTACGGAPFTQRSQKHAFSINTRRRRTFSLRFSLFVLLSAQRPVLFEKC